MAIIVKKVERNLGKITILVVYTLITFFFLVNAEGLFSAWNNNWTFNAIIYMLGVALFTRAVDDLPKELKTPLVKNIIFFCASSIFTLILLLIVRDLGLMFDTTSPMPYHLIFPNMAFHLIIVASSEEIIFRGIIFGYLYDHFKLRPEKQSGEVKKYGWIIPYLGQASIFSIFHLAVYGVDLITMSLLFLMAIIFAYATERWGIGASMDLELYGNRDILPVILCCHYSNIFFRLNLSLKE